MSEPTPLPPHVELTIQPSLRSPFYAYTIFAFTAEQMTAYGRAEYLRGLELAVDMDWTNIMRDGALVTWGDAETLGNRVANAIHALKGQK